MQLLVSALLTIGLIATVEILLGWQTVLSPWTSIGLNNLLIPTVLVLLSYLLRSFRLLDWFYPLPPTAALKVMLQHNLWNNLLPMRTGELSFPILLQRHLGIGAARSLVALGWFRLLDLLCILLILAIAYAWIGNHGYLTLPILVAFALLLPGAHYLTTTILPRSTNALPAPIASRLNIITTALQLDQAKLWRCLAWTIGNWAIKLFAFGYVLTLFANVDLITGIIGAIGGELTSVLPVHGFAGAGTYEAGILGLLYSVDLDYRTALAAGVNLHLFLLSITLLTGIGSQLIPVQSTDSPRPIK